MDGTPINDCSATFLDPGGNGPYAPNLNISTTICPDGTGGPNGTHVRLSFSGLTLGAGDDICFFDGPDATAPQLTCASENPGSTSLITQATAPNLTGCITAVFTSDGSDEGEGWSAAVECITNCQTIIAVLDSSDPPVFPADTGYIDICPGDRVFFNGRGEYPQDGLVYPHSDLDSSFEWDFGDGTFGVGPNVSHTYPEPGGYIVQLTITDMKGCTNTNFITQRVRVSTYPNFDLGGSVPDQVCAGDTINLNAVVELMDSTFNVSVGSNPGGFSQGGIVSDSLALPDGDGTSYSTSIDFTSFSPGAVLTDINDLLGICVNMEHSWMRDLQIEITCPSGNAVILHDHPGPIGGEVYLGEPIDGDGTNPNPGLGYDYCWTPGATNGTWIEYANATGVNTLPSGDYSTFDDLEDLLGCPLNGEWTITVTDLWSIDNGFIFNWSISFADFLYPDLETFQPVITDWAWDTNPSIFFQTQDSIGAAPQNAGSAQYTFSVENDFGCVFDTNLVINVLPNTHPDCYTCVDNLLPMNDTTVCEGEFVVFNAAPPGSGNTLPVTYEAFPLYEFGFANHPPNNAYNSQITTTAINPVVITDALSQIDRVCIDIETDFLSDIDVRLMSPNGNIIDLALGNGGGTDFYTQTCFTPTAATSINAGSSPYTGDYQPEEAWTALNGSLTNGVWTLLVSDAFGPTAYGTLNDWSITFNTENDVQYTWSPASPDISCTNCPNPIIIANASTEYIITSTDSYLCTNSDTISLGVLNATSGPPASWSDDGNGGLLFSWDDIGAGAYTYEINIDGTGWVTPNQTTTSHLYTGGTQGVPVNAEIRVSPSVMTPCPVGTTFISGVLGSVNCQLMVEVAGTQPSTCFCSCNGSIQLSTFNAAAPITYFFYDADTDILLNTISQNSGNFTGICGGNYYVVVEDAAMCMDTTDVFTVAEPEPIEYDVVETMPVSCGGGSDGVASVINITGGSSNYSYQWSDPNGQTGPVATGLSAGTYQVTVIDDVCSNCPIIGSVTITEPVPIQLSIVENDVLCFGESTGSAEVNVTGGTVAGDYDYFWNGGNTPNQSETGQLAAGTYTVTVTDDLNCSMTIDATITEPAACWILGKRMTNAIKLH